MLKQENQAERVCGNSVLLSQFFCKSKTSLLKKSVFKKEKKNVTMRLVFLTGSHSTSDSKSSEVAQSPLAKGVTLRCAHGAYLGTELTLGSPPECAARVFKT